MLPFDKQSPNLQDATNRLAHLLQSRQNKNPSLIKEAFSLAQIASSELKLEKKEAVLNLGLSIAEILSSLNVDDETIAAAILYTSALSTDLKSEDIAEHLGPKVSRLIQDTKEMASFSDLYLANYSSEQQKYNLDNIRKMLLAMVDDIYVVLLKIAERLAVLREAKNLPNEDKQKIAKEALAIYAPLANRLGISLVKLEIEDLAFSYLEPEQYQKIFQHLKQNREEREIYIKDIIAQVTHLLKQNQVTDFKVTGRAKHIYSIYRKMQRKNVSVEEIYDTSAIRILVSSVTDCYAVLSAIHSLWSPIKKEFDDYIATPKPNGYRSIHTAVKGPGNKNLEIQIRTYEMHEFAELGMAAHWVYKEGAPKKPSNYEEKIAWLRQIMAWQEEITSSQNELTKIKDIFNDRVYIFTPLGDILDLPQGATPLDFAYHVHSELGHRCRGAKINGNIVPLTHQLKTGEHVEILKGKEAAPSRDWLNPNLGFLKSPRAKAKIHNWFKKQDHDKHVIFGQDLIENEIHRLGLRNIEIEALAKKLQLTSKEDLYASLGSGDIKLGSITSVLQNIAQAEEKAKLTAVTPTLASANNKTQHRNTDFVVSGIDNMLTNIAQCCKPIPGDVIVGYVTQSRGLSIHRKNCPNIQEFLRNKPDKLLTVEWGSKIDQLYPVDIVVTAFDRTGLARDITNIISTDNIMIHSLNLTIDKNENLAIVHLTINIPGLEALNRILLKLSSIPNVLEVKRNN
ncbi:MAG: bifunctional (p)ppGpp synthetase/guanosine-3',5'-bis(diphosphate) 3'-pyrophosphohydrolase [Gammaproteobacteria bacterium]